MSLAEHQLNDRAVELEQSYLQRLFAEEAAAFRGAGLNTAVEAHPDVHVTAGRLDGPA